MDDLRLEREHASEGGDRLGRGLLECALNVKPPAVIASMAGTPVHEAEMSFECAVGEVARDVGLPVDLGTALAEEAESPRPRRNAASTTISSRASARPRTSSGRFRILRGIAEREGGVERLSAIVHNDVVVQIAKERCEEPHSCAKSRAPRRSPPALRRTLPTYSTKSRARPAGRHAEARVGPEPASCASVAHTYRKICRAGNPNIHQSGAVRRPAMHPRSALVDT
jgi:hypothetical protein